MNRFNWSLCAIVMIVHVPAYFSNLDKFRCLRRTHVHMRVHTRVHTHVHTRVNSGEQDQCLLPRSSISDDAVVATTQLVKAGTQVGIFFKVDITRAGF